MTRTHANQPGAYINGHWQAGEGATFESIDPSTGETSWSGAAASDQQVDQAIASARTAFPAWSARPLEERIKILEAYAQAVAESSEAIAEAISQDMGKTISEARGEAGAVRGKIALAINGYRERTGVRSTPTDFGAAELIHRPHGVAAVLGPYNFPAHLPNGHIVPALLAGNACVFKPSELSPLVAHVLVEAFEAAGLPPGCLNVVHGAGPVGARLVAGDINAVFFTGSSTTGARIHASFAGRPDIRLALEMGGNNPLIVWDAESASQAAGIVLDSAFLTSGQRCTCARRLIIQNTPAGEALLAELATQMASIKIGPASEDDTYLGPLVSSVAANKAVEFQKRLTDLGGRPLVPLMLDAHGPAFVSPGLIDMTDAAQALDEELFGPLLQVFRVSTFDEAIVTANNTRYGLAAGLISADAKNWETFRARIHAGIVNWNRPTVGASGGLPFGGPGFSGNHSPGGSYAADYCAWPMASLVAPPKG